MAAKKKAAAKKHVRTAKKKKTVGAIKKPAAAKGKSTPAPAPVETVTSLPISERERPESQRDHERDEPDSRMVLEVDPENLIIHPLIRQLRVWNGETEHERAIQGIAKSIAEQGQSQPAVGWETDEGIVLVIGQRRMEAVKLLREQGHGTMLQLIVDPNITSLGYAIWKALHENTERENFNAMELARIVRSMRSGELGEAVGAAGAAGAAGAGIGQDVKLNTDTIARYLGKDPATVTQLERLLDLPKDVQGDVEAGVMKWNTALGLLDSPEDKREEVAEVAKTIAAGRAVAKAGKAGKEGKGREHNPRPEVPKFVPGKTPPPPAPKIYKRGDGRGEETDAPVRVTSRDVRQAQNIVPGGVREDKMLRAPKVGDVVDAIGELTDGYPDVMARFTKVFLDWMKATAKWKTVLESWEEIADVLNAMGKGKKGR